MLFHLERMKSSGDGGGRVCMAMWIYSMSMNGALENG